MPKGRKWSWHYLTQDASGFIKARIKETLWTFHCINVRWHHGTIKSWKWEARYVYYMQKKKEEGEEMEEKEKIKEMEKKWRGKSFCISLHDHEFCHLWLCGLEEMEGQELEVILGMPPSILFIFLVSYLHIKIVSISVFLNWKKHT